MARQILGIAGSLAYPSKGSLSDSFRRQDRGGRFWPGVAVRPEAVIRHVQKRTLNAKVTGDLRKEGRSDRTPQGIRVDRMLEFIFPRLSRGNACICSRFRMHIDRSHEGPVRAYAR